MEKTDDELSGERATIRRVSAFPPGSRQGRWVALFLSLRTMRFGGRPRTNSVLAAWHSTTIPQRELGEARVCHDPHRRSAEKCLNDFYCDPAGTRSRKGEGPLALEKRATAAVESDDLKVAYLGTTCQSRRGGRYKSGTDCEVHPLGLATPVPIAADTQHDRTDRGLWCCLRLPPL